MIGKLLKIMRLHKGISLEELSTRIGIEKDLLLQYEEGNIDPDFEMVLVIAKACGYEIIFTSCKDKIVANNHISKDE